MVSVLTRGCGARKGGGGARPPRAARPAGRGRPVPGHRSDGHNRRQRALCALGRRVSIGGFRQRRQQSGFRDHHGRRVGRHPLAADGRSSVKEEINMRKPDFRVLFGILLVVAGALFLLEALDLIVIGGWLWGLAFLVAAAAFIYVYFTNRERWWPLIPGCPLAGIGLTILTGELAPGMGELGGFFVLAGIGLSFLLIYLTRRDYWWALIPGCTLVGIGGGVLAEGLLPSFGQGAPLLL